MQVCLINYEHLLPPVHHDLNLVNKWIWVYKYDFRKFSLHFETSSRNALKIQWFCNWFCSLILLIDSVLIWRNGDQRKSILWKFLCSECLSKLWTFNLHSKTAFQKCLSSFKNCYPKLIYCIPDSLIIFQNCFLELFYYNPNLLKI